MKLKVTRRDVRPWIWTLIGISFGGHLLACPVTFIQDSYRIDFRDPTQEWRVKDITVNHCNQYVTGLTGNARQNDRFKLMADIDYTLKRIPNHYPCLVAMAKYQTRPGFPYYSYEGEKPNASCYVENALVLFPHDVRLWGLLGYSHQLANRLLEAADAYNKAIEKSPLYSEAYYNLGLVYLQRGDVDNALRVAREAYKLGYPLQGLKRKLIARGVWSSEDSGH